MELSRLNVIELTNLALSVATILTRDLTVSETECLLKFLCIVRDDISLYFATNATASPDMLFRTKHTVILTFITVNYYDFQKIDFRKKSSKKLNSTKRKTAVFQNRIFVSP